MGKNHLDVSLDGNLAWILAGEERVIKHAIRDIFQTVKIEIEVCRMQPAFAQSRDRFVKHLYMDLSRFKKRYYKHASRLPWRLKKMLFCLLTALKICKTNPYIKHERETKAAILDFVLYLKAVLKQAVSQAASGSASFSSESVGDEETVHMIEMASDLVSLLAKEQRSAPFFHNLARFLNAWDCLHIQFPNKFLDKVKKCLSRNFVIKEQVPLVSVFENVDVLKAFLRERKELRDAKRLLNLACDPTPEVSFQDWKRVEKLLDKPYKLIRIKGLKTLRLSELPLSLLPRLEQLEPVELDADGFTFQDSAQLEQILHSFPQVTALKLRGSQGIIDIIALLEKMPYLQVLELDAIKDKTLKDEILAKFSCESVSPKILLVGSKSYALECQLGDPKALKWRYLPETNDWIGETLKKAPWSISDCSRILPTLCDVISKRSRKVALDIALAKDLLYAFQTLGLMPADILQDVIDLISKDLNDKKACFEEALEPFDAESASRLFKILRSIDFTASKNLLQRSMQEKGVSESLINFFLEAAELHHAGKKMSCSLFLCIDEMINGIIEDKKEKEFLRGI